MLNIYLVYLYMKSEFRLVKSKMNHSQMILRLFLELNGDITMELSKNLLSGLRFRAYLKSFVT